MKKGIICTVLALMVVLSMTGVVVADDPKVTPVSFTIDSTYTWDVPTGLIVGTDPTEENFGVYAAGFNIPTDATLTISVASGNSFKVKNSAEEEAAYTLSYNGETVSDPAKVLQVAGTATPVGLKILKADWATSAPTKAGVYEDSLTFTATVE